MEAFLEHIGLKLFGMKHYWGRFEFAKSRGQIHLHLLGIVEESSNVNGIYRRMHQLNGDKKEQAKLLAAWAWKRFNMTAEINNSVETNEADHSPCKIRFLKPSLYIKINFNYVCSAICIYAVIIAWSRKKRRKQSHQQLHKK